MAIFSPSMMCARYGNLEQEVKLLEDAGADRLHLDVMDGRFVPNFAMGLEDIRCIADIASIPIELHLMIERPSEYIQLFAAAGVDIIYIHPESDYHPTTVIQKIIESGVVPGIVLNPGTPIESVMELLNVAKKIMIMGVNPGHAGQAYLPYVDKKIRKVLEIKEEYGLEISIDGACSADRIIGWSGAGVDGFVLGTSALFGKPDTYQKNMKHLRELCGGNHG